MIDLSKMKAPRDVRNTWGNGIIQIHITRACDLSCVGCTQGSNLAGKPVMMTVEQFEIAVQTLTNYHGVVGIFGGNPCVHPQFPEICYTLSGYIPSQRRGLWSNNLNGYGKLCRSIFNPAVSNLNVHCNTDAYLEMVHDWPECQPKGLSDSRHSPPFVAMRDLGLSVSTMDSLIESCDVNQLWSAMICVFRNELRGYFCELAGAQSMLHQNEKDYPDTGIRISLSDERQWWEWPMEFYYQQVVKHCYECGIPLRGYGDLAVSGRNEQVSITHANIYKMKSKDKLVQIVTKREQLGEVLTRVTNYIENGEL